MKVQVKDYIYTPINDIKLYGTNKKQGIISFDFISLTICKTKCLLELVRPTTLST